MSVTRNSNIPMNPNVACPCFSGKSYSECCKPFHDGALPLEPLELMRSRYAAYALKLADYIVATTDPDSPLYEKDLNRWKKGIIKFGNMKFTGLDILKTEGEYVTFKAHIQDNNGRDMSFIEKSLFTRKNGKWYYTRGEAGRTKEE